MGIDRQRRLRDQERKNKRFKRLAADMSPDIRILKDPPARGNFPNADLLCAPNGRSSPVRFERKIPDAETALSAAAGGRPQGELVNAHFPFQFTVGCVPMLFPHSK